MNSCVPHKSLSGKGILVPLVVGHAPDSDSLPCVLSPLSRCHSCGYRVSPCPLPWTASTESIGVGRTVRLSAHPALHCVPLGFAGRTGPTTRGTRCHRTTACGTGPHTLRTPEPSGAETRGSDDCRAHWGTRDCASLTGTAGQSGRAMTRVRDPPRCRRGTERGLSSTPELRYRSSQRQRAYIGRASVVSSRRLALTHHPDPPSGHLVPARGGVASFTSPHPGVLSRTGPPAPRALLPRVTTSVIAYVAPWGAAPDETGEPVRLHTHPGCRRLRRWISPRAIKGAGVQ